MSSAHRWSGIRATINYNNPATTKKSGPVIQRDKLRPKASGQKGSGSGKNESRVRAQDKLLPACQSVEGGQWGGSVSAIPLARERQNRKIFFSLIEKNLEQAIKKM